MAPLYCWGWQKRLVPYIVVCHTHKKKFRLIWKRMVNKSTVITYISTVFLWIKAKTGVRRTCIQIVLARPLVVLPYTTRRLEFKVSELMFSRVNANDCRANHCAVPQLGYRDLGWTRPTDRKMATDIYNTSIVQQLSFFHECCAFL